MQLGAKKCCRKIDFFRQKTCTVRESALYLHSQSGNGSVAQLNRVLDYGSSGYRFESCRSHKTVKVFRKRGFHRFCFYRLISLLVAQPRVCGAMWFDVLIFSVHIVCWVRCFYCLHTMFLLFAYNVFPCFMQCFCWWHTMLLVFGPVPFPCTHGMFCHCDAGLMCVCQCGEKRGGIRNGCPLHWSCPDVVRLT